MQLHLRHLWWVSTSHNLVKNKRSSKQRHEKAARVERVESLISFSSTWQREWRDKALSAHTSRQILAFCPPFSLLLVFFMAISYLLVIKFYSVSFACELSWLVGPAPCRYKYLTRAKEKGKSSLLFAFVSEMWEFGGEAFFSVLLPFHLLLLLLLGCATTSWSQWKCSLTGKRCGWGESEKAEKRRLLCEPWKKVLI